VGNPIRSGSATMVQLVFSSPVELPQNATAWDYMAMYDEANGNDLRTDAGIPGGAVYGPA